MNRPAHGPLISRIKGLLPSSLEPGAIRLWYAARPALKLLFGGRNRYCPVCESWTRAFLAHGPSSRARRDVVCPICLSHDRQRLAWVFLHSFTALEDGSPKSLLHLAPETELGRKLRRIPALRYRSADLESPHAMATMDITDLDWPDDSFDALCCSHVLEHVPDDRRAIGELYRVLKPGGWALIQVPISKQGTIEDASVTDPAQREERFWQRDHVRLYGLDIQDRLAAAGFHVEVVTSRQLVEEHRREQMALPKREPLFYCTKSAMEGE